MDAIFSHGYALLVGVGGSDIPNTVTDAQGLAALLADPARCAYPPAQVRLLAGEQATRPAVLAGLEWLAQAAWPQDTVLVYFSGHGYRAAASLGEFTYLLPHGYELARLYQTALRGDEFAARLAAIPAGRLLALLDCCHAGGIDAAQSPGLELAKAPLPPEALALLGQGRGRVLVASSQADELSFAGKPYSAFTLALVEALCGVGAAEKDGLVRVADLALHARQVVPGRTGSRQHPILHFEAADNFAVAYYAAGEARPKSLPFDEPQIEPQPGAWASQINPSRRAIRTGGGAYVEGDVNTGGGDFVGRDSNVRADRGGIAIGGDAYNNTMVTGSGNLVAPEGEITLSGFLALLDQMQANLDQPGLDADLRQEIGENIDKARQQAARPKPNRAIIPEE